MEEGFDSSSNSVKEIFLWLPFFLEMKSIEAQCSIGGFHSIPSHLSEAMLKAA